MTGVRFTAARAETASEPLQSQCAMCVGICVDLLDAAST